MRFINTALGWAPTDGAIVPHLFKYGVEGTKEMVKENIKNTISTTIAEWLQAIGEWLATDGVVLAAELALVWGMICFLIACTGNGKWMEQGTKSILISIGLGVARLAIPL